MDDDHKCNKENCYGNCEDCEYAIGLGGLEGLTEVIMKMQFVQIMNQISSLQQSIARLGQTGNDYLIKEFADPAFRESINEAAVMFAEKYPMIDVETLKFDSLLLVNSIERYLAERNPVIDGLENPFDKFSS